MNPYLPPHRDDCKGNHLQIIAWAKEPARCRRCNHLVLPSGRVSKVKKVER